MPSNHARPHSVLAGVPNEVPSVRPSEIYRGMTAQAFDAWVREWTCPCEHEIHILRFGQVQEQQEYIGADSDGSDFTNRIITAPFTVRKRITSQPIAGPRFIVEMVQVRHPLHTSPEDLQHMREQQEAGSRRWRQAQAPLAQALEQQSLSFSQYQRLQQTVAQQAQSGFRVWSIFDDPNGPNF